MTPKLGDAPPELPREIRAGPPPIRYFLYLAAALAAAASLTGIGAVIAFIQAEETRFWQEWVASQAFPCLAFGIWLFLIARSGAMEERVRLLTQASTDPPAGTTALWQRLAITIPIGAGGTASLIGLGFDADGFLLLFFWMMAALVCFLAAFITLHTIDLLTTLHNLKAASISLFQYSPARTPALRMLIAYFTVFTFLLSIGFFFAALGTFKGHWTGNESYIQTVQWFWPAIYVPICSAALIYPHLAVHAVVQEAKERTLSAYKREIDVLLEKYPKLENENVDRVNSLAQLFDRISATPDYVIDLGIAFRTALPLLFNVAILVAKPLLGAPS